MLRSVSVVAPCRPGPFPVETCALASASLPFLPTFGPLYLFPLLPFLPERMLGDFSPKNKFTFFVTDVFSNKK